MFNRVIRRGFCLFKKQNGTAFQKQLGLHSQVIRIHKRQQSKQKLHQFQNSVPLFILISVALYYLINNDGQKGIRLRCRFQIYKYQLCNMSVIVGTMVSSSNKRQLQLLQAYFQYAQKVKKGQPMLHNIVQFIKLNQPQLQKLETFEKVMKILSKNLDWLQNRPNHYALQNLKQLCILLRKYKHIDSRVYNQICSMLTTHGNIECQYLGLLYGQLQLSPKMISRWNQNQKEIPYLLDNSSHDYIKFKRNQYKRYYLFVMNKIMEQGYADQIKIDEQLFKRFVD